MKKLLLLLAITGTLFACDKDKENTPEIPEGEGWVVPNSQKFMPQINIDPSNIIPGVGKPEFKNQEYSTDLSSGYFFKAGNSNAKIHIQANFSVYGEAGDRSNPIEFVKIHITARMRNGNIRLLNSDIHSIQFDNSAPIPIFRGDIIIDYDQNKTGQEVLLGEEVFLYIECNNKVQKFKYTTFDHFDVNI